MPEVSSWSSSGRKIVVDIRKILKCRYNFWYVNETWENVGLHEQGYSGLFLVTESPDRIMPHIKNKKTSYAYICAIGM